MWERWLSSFLTPVLPPSRLARLFHLRSLRPREGGCQAEVWHPQKNVLMTGMLFIELRLAGHHHSEAEMKGVHGELMMSLE